MAGFGFLQSLWEKPIWEGVWHITWIPWDCVCVFTHSIRGVECAREVYGRHCELFFLLIKKEPATSAGQRDL